MPIGRLCRACGAKLSGDVGWCSRCLAPVTLYSPRAPLHEPGGYVGAPMNAPRTSRWRGGATSFGPAGRILCTLGLAALFPWWGLGGFDPFFLWALMGWLLAAGLVLRSVWKQERIVDPAPTRLEGSRTRHPVLGRELRFGRGARSVVLLIAAGGAVAAWLSLDDAARYVWTVVAIVSGLGIFLSIWNDL
jgi:hypothetical protein